MRILLVSPPSGDLTIGLKHLAKVEPLGLEIIGAAVSDHQVELLDMELDTDLIGTLQRFRRIQFSALSTTVVRRVDT